MPTIVDNYLCFIEITLSHSAYKVMTAKQKGALFFLAGFEAVFQEKVRGPSNDRREAFHSTLKNSKKWR
jgi:hypothetical protein